MPAWAQRFAGWIYAATLSAFDIASKPVSILAFYEHTRADIVADVAGGGFGIRDYHLLRRVAAWRSR